MHDNITVYEKPTCTKCREMDRFLRESSVDFSKINYYLEPLSEKKLRELIKKIGIKPREVLRTSREEDFSAFARGRCGLSRPCGLRSGLLCLLLRCLLDRCAQRVHQVDLRRLRCGLRLRDLLAGQLGLEHPAQILAVRAGERLTVELGDEALDHLAREVELGLLDVRLAHRLADLGL